MKLNPKQLAVSAALLGLLAAGAALPAAAASPISAPAAITFPWSPVAAESVETGDYAPTMTVGTAQQLSPVVQPQKAASRNGVSYVSDNPNIVSVGEDGVAQAVGLGTANITATCGDVSCTYTITPQPDSPMIATEMDITLASSTIAVGDTTSLSLAVLPTSAANYINVSLSSSNEKVATVNNFGKVTGVAPGKATITAISDHGDRAACEVTVTRKGEEAEAQKPTLSETSLELVQQYDVLHPAKQLTLTNSDHSFIYVYQWRSSDPNIASVDDKGVVTAQKPGSATITAFASNGQALRCAVTVTSEVGKVTLNKTDLLLKTVGSQEALCATVAVESGGSVPITWVTSNPGVATVDTNGVVTAVADGEAKITALSPSGRYAVCSVVVGLAGDKYDTEELKLPDPYVAVRLNRLS